MLVYNLIKERLFFHGFSHWEMDWTIKLGIVAFRRGHINVFLKAYDKNIEVTEILKDTIKVRKELEKNFEVNIWNSYMLICPEKSSESHIDLVMKVEKDTIALRKYLIWEESDINRIPFLDSTDSESVKPKRILNEEYKDLEEINELVNFVQELTLQEGGKIAPKRLRDILETKLLKEVSHNENRKD